MKVFRYLEFLVPDRMSVALPTLSQYSLNTERDKGARVFVLRQRCGVPACTSEDKVSVQANLDTIPVWALITPRVILVST